MAAGRCQHCWVLACISKEVSATALRGTDHLGAGAPSRCTPLLPSCQVYVGQPLPMLKSLEACAVQAWAETPPALVPTGSLPREVSRTHRRPYSS